MTSDGIAVRVESADFQRLFGKSSEVEKTLKTALRRNIRVAGQAAAGAVRAEVGSSSGLRGAIAAGIGLKVMTGKRAGVAVVASAKAMGPGQASLVRGWESKKGWRHPVFGKDEWIVQHGRPFFRRTILAQQPQVRAAVEAAMGEAVESLKG